MEGVFAMNNNYYFNQHVARHAARSRANTRRLGEIGERVAQDYLTSKGYYILDTNFYTKHGEIDIVAVENRILVFVEVKSRSSIEYGLPLEQVIRKKQDRIISSARMYIMKKRPPYRQYRFDVVSVMFDGELNPVDITLLKNAFDSAGV